MGGTNLQQLARARSSARGGGGAVQRRCASGLGAARGGRRARSGRGCRARVRAGSAQPGAAARSIAPRTGVQTHQSSRMP